MIAAFAGVMGIALGRLWDSRAESARWRRDQRAATYVRLAEAYWDVFRAIDGIASTEGTEALGDSRRWSALSDRAGPALDRWNGALLAALVYGSPAVAEAATVVDSLIDNLGTKAGGACHDWEVWERETKPLKQAFQDLMAIIRNDLDLKAHAAVF
ncbi:hypothetical protein [Nocardia sp. NPDC004722]